MGKIAKGVNTINFTILYGNYCYIIIENFPKKLSPCTRVLIFAMLVGADASDDGYVSETIWQSHILIFIYRLP